MNDPKEQPIDIEDQRQWLREHKEATGQSWNQLGQRLKIKTGTLSQFGGPSGYGGNELPLAEIVFRYRQTLTAQAALTVEVPELPGYFQTETSAKLIHLMQWAQRGRITMAALSPGLGKSISADHFQACNANVFKATMKPSTKSIHTMVQEVLWSLGDIDAYGSTRALCRRIRTKLKDLGNPLVIIDEAHHLDVESFDEIRSWNDEYGVGIALLGHTSLQQALHGRRAQSFAQLTSRVSLRLVRNFPLGADIEALIEAWRIHDEKAAALVTTIAKMPGALREATYTLELATMIAHSERAELGVSHIQDAWAQRSSSAMQS